MEKLLPNWLIAESLFSIPIWNWGLALLLAIVSFIMMVVLLKFSIARLREHADKVKTKFSEIITELLSATNWLLLGFIALFIGSDVLSMPARWSVTVSHFWFIVLALQVGLWLHRVVKIWKRDHLASSSDANVVVATLLTTLLQAVVWIIVLLAILENAGVNITTLVASLGVGGVAIALAVQTVLGDLFAAIAIAVDKPFQVGDSITAGDISGSVERIGLKSTHIRSISGEQVVCSNTELLKRTIQNFKRMVERRVVFRFNVSYRTPVDTVEKIPAAIKEYISGLAGARFGRAHFVKLGNVALEFEVVFYILDADYDHFMNLQQDINLKILHILIAMEADLALPDGSNAMNSIKISPAPDVSPAPA